MSRCSSDLLCSILSFEKFRHSQWTFCTFNQRKNYYYNSEIKSNWMYAWIFFFFYYLDMVIPKVLSIFSGTPCILYIPISTNIMLHSLLYKMRVKIVRSILLIFSLSAAFPSLRRASLTAFHLSELNLNYVECIRLITISIGLCYK